MFSVDSLRDTFSERLAKAPSFARFDTPQTSSGGSRKPKRRWVLANDDSLVMMVWQEFIKRFPKTDHPAAFGQHVNADITSLIEETNALLGTMVSCSSCICYLSRFRQYCRRASALFSLRGFLRRSAMWILPFPSSLPPPLACACLPVDLTGAPLISLCVSTTDFAGTEGRIRGRRDQRGEDQQAG